MNFTFGIIVLGISLSMLIVILVEVGRRIGIRRNRLDPEMASAGTGTVEGAILALLGLIIAFTFSGALSRFDYRRQLVGEEANAIGTAWLRVDLLPQSAQPAVRDAFRKYLDSRLKTYALVPDMDAVQRELEHSQQLQQQIWNLSVTVCRESGAREATMLLLPALNQMIDITTTRTIATTMHPPEIIFYMLVAVAAISGLMAGFGMARAKQRSWLHIIGLAIVLAATVYVILDLEFPRVGLIRMDDADQFLRDVRASMG